MKKIILLLLFFCSLQAVSQTQLWGVSESGGTHGDGTIFMADSLGNNLHSVYSFEGFNGAAPLGGLTLAGNGNLYGVTLLGGFSGSCVIFCYNPITGITTNIHDFAAVPQYGDDAHSEMIVANNGKMYGLCNYGGLYNKGTIFQLDTFNNYTDLLDFTDTTGSVPLGRLLQANNGLLYGMTTAGGTNNVGTIFSYSINTSVYTKLYDCNATTGSAGMGLIQATNGLLYGMASNGGTNGGGVIFSFNISNNTYTNLHNFNNIQGYGPTGTLLQASNGKLYGMTEQGGSGDGILFSFNISTNSFTDLFNFNGTNGSKPRRTLKQTSNGTLFGVTYQGGTNNYGVAFKYDISTNTYTKIIDFNATTTGANPDCNFIETPVLVHCTNDTTLFVTSTSCTGYTLGSQTYYTSGTYTQVLTNVRGCDSLLTLHLSFGTLPVVTVNSAFICSGTSITLTATGDSSYTWSAGATPTGVNTATVSPTVTTTYTVTSTTSGCSAISTIMVHPSPDPPNIRGDYPYNIHCDGDTATYYIDDSPTTNPYYWLNQYSWLGPNGVVSTGTSWHIGNASTSLNGTYSVTSSRNGCTSTPTNFTISVSPHPFIFYGGSQTICSGDATSYTPLITPPISSNPYTSSVGVLWTATSSSPNISGYYNSGTPWHSNISQVLTNSGTTSETVTYLVHTYTTYCSGNSVTFTVTVKPKPHVTVTASSPIICQAGIDTLIANGASSYVWSAGATAFGINSASISPTSTATYTVTGTLNGCTNTAVSTVSVNPTPVITVNAPAICLGQTATLTASGAATYTWSAGLTPTGINTATVSPTVTTTYTVTGTSCGNSVSRTVTVFVNRIPNVTAFTYSPTICVGYSPTIYANGASSYTWSAGATALDASSANVSPTITTTYTVTGTSVCGISDSATITFTVYPLPVITVNSPTICRGDTATLIVHGGQSYWWYYNRPTITGDSTAIAYPIYSETYYVSGGSSTIAGCSSSAIATVTVIQRPTVSVNSPTICAGNIATLVANGASSYSWSAGATAIGGDTAIANPITTTSYTVTGISGTCSNTAVATVTVNSALPVAVNSPEICIGNTATLVASGASTYTWSAGVTSTGANTATVSPTNNTTYTVTGTSGTCTASAIATVTVNSLPIVTATASSPTICPNSMERLNGGGASTYVWNNGIYNNSPFPISNQINDTVIGTDVHGCKGMASIELTLLPSPTVIAHASPQIICQGDSVLFTATGNAAIYTWNHGITDGVPYVPNTSGLYVVTGADTNMCSSASAVFVTVNQLPTVTVTSPTICTGQTATLTASGAASYSWSADAIPTGTNTASVSPIATATYTVIGTGLHNCISTAVSVVTVNPNLNPIVAVDSSAICRGQLATLTASGAATYSWSVGATSTGVNTATASPQSTQVYSVIGSTNGCSDTAYSLVTVNPSPTITVNSPSLCIVTNDTLVAHGAVSYVWSAGAIPIGVDSAFVNPTSTTSYTVTGTSANGCIDSAVSVVTINPVPSQPSPISGPVNVCGGIASIYSVVDDPNNATYTWSLPATWLGSSDSSLIATTTDSIGGIISVVANNRCGNSIPQTLAVNGSAMPVVSFATLGTVCEDAAPFVLNSASPAGGTYSGIGVNNNVFTPSSVSSGTYFVTYTYVSGACTVADSMPITVDLCTGINQLNSTDGIRIYPNPATSSFTIQSVNKIKEIKMINLLGEVVYQSEINNTQSEINTSQLTKGIYFVQITNENNYTINRKVVVE